MRPAYRDYDSGYPPHTLRRLFAAVAISWTYVGLLAWLLT